MSHGAVATVRAVPAISTTLNKPAPATAPTRLAPTSTLYAVGANACSFAMRSVHDTKETVLLVCIGFLEALDSLQTKLHLPTALVKDLKRRLLKMVDRSLTRPVTAPTCAKIDRAERLGERIAESDAWTDVAAKPEEVRGFGHWLLAVMKWLNDLAFAGTVGACRRIFILILRFPGVPTACSLFCRLFDMVERTLHIGSSTAPATTIDQNAVTPRKTKRARYDHYMDDSSLTAVVLEYREKECMVPVNINRRIQQFMHFEIPLRSFEATVRLPSDSSDPSGSRRSGRRPSQTGSSAARFLEDLEELDAAHESTSSSLSSSSSSPGGPSSSSPRSIPVSPRARKKFELIYANYFDDVLYQARDKLRLQRAVNLTGETNRQIPRFNKYECDQEVHLTCGRNCAVKEGPGLYRSVRGTVSILRNRYVYFEMELSSGPSPTIASGVVVSVREEISSCIGIAPRSMPLNTLVGTARNSVGFYSAGHVLVGGQQRSFKAVSPGYSCPSTVGVLVYIHDETAQNGVVDQGAENAVATTVAHAEVQFSVNGQAVRDRDGDIMIARFWFPSRVELFPTVSLHTIGVRAYAQFSSPDIATFDPSSFLLPPDDFDQVVCLDGLKLPVSESKSVL